MAELDDISFEIRPRRWNRFRTLTQQRGLERLFYSIGVDTARTKDKRETKDHLEKDCREGWKQDRVEELEYSQGEGTEWRVLVREKDSLIRVLAR